jgi:hypothetical protein
MQTDPNFANYRWQTDTGRLLLRLQRHSRNQGGDGEGISHNASRGARGDRNGLRGAALNAGTKGPAAVHFYSEHMDEMIDIVLVELTRPGEFDFGDRRFVEALRCRGLDNAADQRAWHLPPADLFTQRKISGTALLASRLKARDDVRSLVTAFV